MPLVAVDTFPNPAAVLAAAAAPPPPHLVTAPPPPELLAAAAQNQGGGYAEVRGGVTYFNQAPIVQRPVVVNKRPKAAIPIVDPSEIGGAGGVEGDEQAVAVVTAAPGKVEGPNNTATTTNTTNSAAAVEN